MSEAQIKAALDGWFFKFNHVNGEVKARRVPRDFMPDHCPPSSSNTGENSNWEAWQDDTIRTMREAGEFWHDIAKAVGKSASTVNKRYSELCLKEGKKRTDIGVRAFHRYSQEVEDKVVAMRHRGLQYTEIGERLGMTHLQTYAVYRRYRDREQRA